MNTQRKNRWSSCLAMLLVCAMVLGLAPAVWADGATPTIDITGGAAEIKVGETARFTAVVTPAGQTVTWVSGDPSIATVDQDGTVHGINAGTATIEASASVVASGGQTLTVSKTVTVRVNPRDPAPTVTITTKSLELQVNQTAKLSAVVKPDTVSDKTVVWSTSDAKIAVVDSSGVVTAIGCGTAEIRASAVAGGESDTCVVKVIREVEGVTLNANTLTISKGSETTLTAMVSPADATNKNVTWASSNPAVASVDTNGKVTAVGVGTATITATTASGGKQASCVITVETGKDAVTGVTVSPTAQTVVAGDTLQLTATVLPADAANKNVVWSTSSSNIATVSNTGLVTAKLAGTVNITAASAEDNTKIATCVVTVVSKGITLSASKLTLQTDGTGVLTASTNPATVANTVTWSSSNTNVLRVSAQAGASCILMPVAAGTATVTATLNYNGSRYTASCAVTVGKGSASVVSYRTEEDEQVDFDDSDFNSVCRNLTGSRLSYIQFSTLPSTAQGALYYDYVPSSNSNTKVSTGRRYSYDSPSPYLSRVTFVPTEGYAGTVTIDYTGWDENGKDFMGQVEITVGHGKSGDLSYTTAKNTPVALRDTDFSDYSKRETGYTFDYIQFTTLPSATQGTLYYSYTSRNSETVRRNTRYYRDESPYLDEITFVPADGFNGTVVIPFTGYNTRDKKFTGELTITVGRGSDEIRYTTKKNTAVRLLERDFSDYCQDQTRDVLDYVQFTTLPSATRGTLYYNYSATTQNNEAVKRNSRYYRIGSPYLDSVTFVPAADFTGTVTVPFTGYSATGGWFSGNMIITVGTAGGDINYVTEKNTPVSLLERDFVNYSKDQTRYTFDYVQFTTLPSATRGTLYYSYRASAKDNETVKRNSRYYRDDSPYLEDITFVPADNFTGTVTIPFTGYSDNGEKFSGDMKITVGGGGDVTYSATAGQDVGFDDVDFNDFCKSETGANLDFVQFTLPNSSLGALYSGSKKASSSSTKYYRSSTSPYIDNVTFSPSKNITGDIRIPFTGESVRGDVFSGTVVISYTAAPGVIKYSSSGGAVTFKAKDFSDACAIRGGKAALSSVRFDSATTTNGKLYASYANGTGSTVNTSTSYKVSGSPSLGNVTFVPKSGYSGKVNLTYTGTDANGGTYRGTVEITVTPAVANTNFTDMGNHSWAASSVDFLSKSGVVTGVDNKHFGPEKPITRGDFVLMLYRAFNMKSSGKVSFSDVPQNSYYAEAVAAAKALGIATGSNGKFNPGAPLTRQDAMVLIQRTMSATGRPLVAGDTSTLNSFTDRNRVSEYAANAVAALVRSGLIKGDDGKLNPNASISRAEMAVLLHRVLTM